MPICLSFNVALSSECRRDHVRTELFVMDISFLSFANQVS